METREQQLEKAKNDIINLLKNTNYTETFKLSRIDELIEQYKFQAEKAIEEGIEY